MNDTKILVAYWHARGVNPTPDLVTTSGSGIRPRHQPAGRPGPDPHGVQGHRALRPVLRHLISQQTQGAELGFLGTSYIDVLQLNEALVKLKA